MATKTTKKTVADKKTATKKTTAKKVVKKEKIDAVPKKVDAQPTETKIEKKAPLVEEVKSERTYYGATPFSHALFVIMTVILWAFLTAWIVIELNYEVKIEHKDVIARRIERRKARLRQEQRMKKAAIRKLVHYTALDQKTGKPIAVVTPVNKTKTSPRKTIRPAKSVSPRQAIPMGKKASNPPLRLAERKASFIESEYAPYVGTGHAIIEGNTCFELADGTTKCFENANVFINPVTTYSDEWYNRGWAGKEFLAKADERAIAYNKMIKSGKDGAFKFESLKPGSYYVGAMVCLPDTKDSKRCVCTRYASKVTMKNRVKTTLKKVFPIE